MTRGVAAMLAVLLIAHLVTPAASALAQAAEPFPEVMLPRNTERTHRWAYVTMLAGAGLAAGSFAFKDRGDAAYDRYLAETEPAAITEHYDRAHRYDQLSTTALIGGEVVFAAGVWMRFLRRGTSDRLAVDVGPARCALSLRF